MLMIQPTLEMGEAWSKDRLAPMIRDTPALTERVGDPRSREKGSTIRYKTFPGGHLTVAGANSPASLASRPVRLVLFDEVDRFPASAGAEGDPISLARKRTTTFWNRKVVMTSTPTIKGLSRIEAAYEESTQERFEVKCPHCEHAQTLRWSQVVWNKPADASYACEECGAAWTDAERWLALRTGEWVAKFPDRPVRGFHLNELYSPWVRLAETVEAFLSAKRSPETLKTWVNTALGETWEQTGEVTFDAQRMADERVEDWDALPTQALVLTAGVDVQRDRLECELVAWAQDHESWSVEYVVFEGDPREPATQANSPWKLLDEFCRGQWEREDGTSLSVSGVCVDSGYLPDEVYQYTKERERRGFVAIKGAAGQGAPALGKRTRNNRHNALLLMLGVDTLKMRIYTRLSIHEPGPGFCHFPLDRGVEYFEQLTAEKPIPRYRKGHPVVEWILPSGARNEPLDCRAYAVAALEYRRPRWGLVEKRLEQAAAQLGVRPEPKEPRPEPKKPRRRKRPGNFATRW
jgi:phage terminase large subunit GpA-like protein